MISLFKSMRLALLACFVMAPSLLFAAWQYPPASGITYTNESFTQITNTTRNLQALIAWLDDNALFSGSGYVTADTLNTRLSSTSTQKFGQVSVLLAPTNAYIQLGIFYGFVGNLTNGGSHACTNIANYGQITNIGTATYNPQSWFATTNCKFTPLVEGYYWLGADLIGSATCTVRIVSYDSNQIVNIGTVVGTNFPLSGGGIMWANGTSTNTFWLEGVCSGGAVTSTFTKVKFQGHYIGK